MLNDDLISAYLDGELDAERRAMVEHQLRTDKGAAARLERMRASDHALRKAFPAVEAKDDFLATMILTTSQPSRSHDWAKRAAALAAAVIVGLALGQFVRIGDNSITPYAISLEEARLLDSQPSGRVTTTSDGAFEVVLSLQSEAGDTCRQFRLTRDMQSTDVLACRRGEEAWHMVAAASAASAEGYVPAGGNSPLDAAIEALGPVEALDASAEAELLERNMRQLP